VPSEEDESEHQFRRSVQVVPIVFTVKPKAQRPVFFTDDLCDTLDDLGLLSEEEAATKGA